MHDDDKLKLAREASAKVSEEQGYHETATALRNGKHDDFDSVQCALAAINALDPQLVEAVGLLREIEAQFRFYGDNHAAKPDPVKAKTNYDWADRISAFLAKQGDA